MSKELNRARRKLEKARAAFECDYIHDSLSGPIIKCLDEQLCRCDDLVAQSRGGLCNVATGENCD